MPVGATSTVEPGELEGAVGAREGDGAVRVQGEPPAAFVHQVMVPVHNGSRLAKSVGPGGATG